MHLSYVYTYSQRSFEVISQNYGRKGVDENSGTQNTKFSGSDSAIDTRVARLRPEIPGPSLKMNSEIISLVRCLEVLK